MYMLPPMPAYDTCSSGKLLCASAAYFWAHPNKVGQSLPCTSVWSTSTFRQEQSRYRFQKKVRRHEQLQAAVGCMYHVQQGITAPAPAPLHSNSPAGVGSGCGYLLEVAEAAAAAPGKPAGLALCCCHRVSNPIRRSAGSCPLAGARLSQPLSGGGSRYRQQTPGPLSACCKSQTSCQGSHAAQSRWQLRLVLLLPFLSSALLFCKLPPSLATITMQDIQKQPQKAGTRRSHPQYRWFAWSTRHETDRTIGHFERERER